MLLGELRSILTNYLNGFLRIDDWGLRIPEATRGELPSSMALDKPANNLVFADSGVGYGNSHQRYVSTTIPFQITYRLDSSYRYIELPRAEAENVLSEIILDLLSFDCLHRDIQELKPTGSVSVAEIKNGDWLIIIEIDFFVKFDASRNKIKSEIFMNLS